MECLVAIAITGVAAAALLLGIETSLKTSQSIVETAIAQGLAKQLMDEIALCRYHEPGEGWDQTNLGPEPDDMGPGRSGWDDIDDFAELVDAPPTDLWGNPLGTDSGEPDPRAAAFAPPTPLLGNLTRTVSVQYVDPEDPAEPLPVGVTSPQRLVTVRVLASNPDGSQRELVRLSRSFAYVP